MAGDDAGDGRLTVGEGVPAYGPVVVPLTTTDGVFPTATTTGRLAYLRGNIEVSAEVAAEVAVSQAVVVGHGVDYDGDGQYDPVGPPTEGEPAPSDEATDRALCGVLSAQDECQPESGETGRL